MNQFDFDDFMIEHNDSVKLIDIDSSKVNVYAVGDVHGCYNEMLEMYLKCLSHAVDHDKEARVIFLGDIIDRGPNFLEIFSFLRSVPNAESILGNHELNFYLEDLGNKLCRSKARKVNHDRMLNFNEADQNMIRKTIGDMPNVFIIELYSGDGKTYVPFMLSHSPIRNIEYCSESALGTLNGPQCCMRNEAVDMDALEENTEGLIMVHGHQSWNFKPIGDQLYEQTEYTNTVINLDSGCVYGEKLTALCLNSMEVLEVDAQNVYHERN